jgi:hypothetical protein
MKYRTRIRYTETDKALMWERWRQGESLQRIAQLFDRNHSAIGGILSRTGGIRPSPRRRSLLALKLEERATAALKLEAAALAVVVSLRDFRSKNRAWLGACATPRLPSWHLSLPTFTRRSR